MLWNAQLWTLAGEGQTAYLKCSRQILMQPAKLWWTWVHENAVWPAWGPQNCIIPGSDAADTQDTFDSSIPGVTQQVVSGPGCGFAWEKAFIGLYGQNHLITIHYRLVTLKNYLWRQQLNSYFSSCLTHLIIILFFVMNSINQKHVG